ncbi:hypothetical protein L3Q82_007128 [Scortum barcoo]|uniref:Uncharacterized protein n=1 Tax=Scortum barcoo TaxID=214431 RepID=A0ACB8WS35_9TELE|nr:hypothetical protein L3Q82_007128 [Scortum barcoo]
MNQELETALRCMASQHPSSWSQQLLWVEYAHNTLTCSATGLSPFFQCAYGFQPPLFPDLEEEVSCPSVQAFIRRCHWTWTQTRAALELRFTEAVNRRRSQAPTLPGQPKGVALHTGSTPTSRVTKSDHGFLHVTFSTLASSKSFTERHPLTNRRSSPSLPLGHPTGDHLFAYGRLPTTPVEEEEIEANPKARSVDMSAASCLLTEDQFLCSICLDVFMCSLIQSAHHVDTTSVKPASLNTGTLMSCVSVQIVIRFSTQDLSCRSILSSLRWLLSSDSQLNRKPAAAAQSNKCPNQEKFPVTSAQETKLKALKSCLVCLASYCKIHLEPHLTASRLKRHQLMEPVENLEGRMCTKHDKLLELFCKTDQMCVCMLCTVSDHKTHDVVPLKEEYEGKKAELGKTEAEIQQMIQKRRLKIEEIKQSGGAQSQAELIHTIKEKQRKTEKQAEGFIKELEQEISELKKRSSEVKQLSQSEDHLHLLQSFPSLNAAPPTKNWTEVSVHPPSYEGTVRRAVNQLEETLSKLMKKLFELKRVQQYAVDVTLDPDTANPNLILSDGGKQVHDSDVEKKLPDNTERFDYCPCVLAKQSFSSGRFYYEVQVKGKGKTDWDLGVARESINRKGQITVSPQDGYWMIWLRNENEYKALAGPDVCLSLKQQPEKVGVFVDYEEGLVSFYDVDAAALIYSFTGCCFTEKLFPYFSPFLNDGGKNSAPLIISAREIHPSIHPSSSIRLVRDRVGSGGSSLSRDAQTSLTPDTSSSSSGGIPRGVPRPAERHSLSSVSWVFPEASSRWDTPGTPP